MNLLCVGDSVTYGYDVAPQNRWTYIVAKRTGIHICNEGVCGDTTAGMLQRMQMINLRDYDAVCVMGGSNDILQDEPLEHSKAHMLYMMQQITDAGKPLFIGIPPLTKIESAFFGWQKRNDVERHNMILQTYRQWLLIQCPLYGAVPIDFYKRILDAEAADKTSYYADGVHPNEAGYAIMAEEAIRCLQYIVKTKIIT